MKANKTKTKVQKELIQYVRVNREHRIQKIGVLYATVVNKRIKIGAAKVNEKAGDTFDAVRGLEIAKGKALLSEHPHFALSLKKHFRRFEDRCTRYFKGAKLTPVKVEKIGNTIHLCYT